MSAQEKLRDAITSLEHACEETEDPDFEGDVRNILDTCYRLDRAVRDSTEVHQ